MPDQERIVRIAHQGRKAKLVVPDELAEKYDKAEFAVADTDEGILYQPVAWPGRPKATVNLASLKQNRKANWLNKATPGEILAQLRELAQDLGRSPTSGDWQAWGKGVVHERRVRETFGGWAEAIELAGLPPVERYKLTHEDRALQASRYQRRYEDEELLGWLADCAKELGRTPGIAAFNRWKGHQAGQLLILRFGSWSAACKRVGLIPHRQPAKMGQRVFTDEQVQAAYLRIRALAGRPPSIAEWNEHHRHGEPTSHTVRGRYGNRWMEFLKAMEAE